MALGGCRGPVSHSGGPRPGEWSGVRALGPVYVPVPTRVPDPVFGPRSGLGYSTGRRLSGRDPVDMGNILKVRCPDRVCGAHGEFHGGSVHDVVDPYGKGSCWWSRWGSSRTIRRGQCPTFGSTDRGRNHVVHRGLHGGQHSSHPALPGVGVPPVLGPSPGRVDMLRMWKGRRFIYSIKKSTTSTTYPYHRFRPSKKGFWWISVFGLPTTRPDPTLGVDPTLPPSLRSLGSVWEILPHSVFPRRILRGRPSPGTVGPDPEGRSGVGRTDPSPRLLSLCCGPERWSPAVPVRDSSVRGGRPREWATEVGRPLSRRQRDASKGPVSSLHKVRRRFPYGYRRSAPT